MTAQPTPTTEVAMSSTHEALSRPGDPDQVFYDEFKRVFGSCHVDELGRVWADGWPDPYLYQEETATEVLRRFPANHGTTEAGDAEVCGVLCRRAQVPAPLGDSS